MRRIIAYFSGPGRFIFLVAAIVLIGAAFLWRSMRAVPEYAVSSSQKTAITEKDATIARALLDMASMAFEEPLADKLEEGVKQADFALVQAMLRTDISPDETAIEKTELRQNALGAYHYQRLSVSVGDDPLPFLTNLHDSLKAWADRTELAQAGTGETPPVWTISVMGIVTHEIVLRPDSQHARPGGAGNTPDGPGRILRRRSPGEPARLVIVIDDIGEDMGALRSLMRLPFLVTCAVWPRSTNAKKAAETAHAAGREVLIHQPTEPMKYPEMNPGPGALFVSLPDAEIENRVRDSLARVPHAVGMNNHMGSRFTRDSRSAAAMVRPLKKAGFFVLDSMTHPGSVLHKEAAKHNLPALKRDIFLDAEYSKENVLRQLRRAEKIALVTGRAIAIGHPLPGTLAALKEWEGMRDSQVELVKLSDFIESP